MTKDQLSPAERIAMAQKHSQPDPDGFYQSDFDDAVLVGRIDGRNRGTARVKVQGGKERTVNTRKAVDVVRHGDKLIPIPSNRQDAPGTTLTIDKLNLLARNSASLGRLHRETRKALSKSKPHPVIPNH